jgi:peroxiredoxin
MGLRSNRYSMLVKDGKVASLNIEAPGKFEVSDAAPCWPRPRADLSAGHP